MSNNNRQIAMISTHGYVAANPELGKPDTGGQVVYVLELSRCFARMGYEVEIWTRQFENQPAIEAVSGGVTLRRFPCGGPDFVPKETLCDAMPEWAAAAAEHITQSGRPCPTLITHYWDAGIAGRLLAEQFGAEHVHVPHSLGAWKRDNMPGGPEEKESRWNFSRRIREERLIYAAASRVIATTAQQQGLLVGPEYDAAPDKVSVIPPGYDDDRFHPVPSSARMQIKRRLGLEGPIILALGRLARNKGYDLLICAMGPVVERLPDARLVLAVGSTSLNEDERGLLTHLKALADALGLGANVVFQDYIPDDLLANYYHAADVFALSSRYEPFGMTAIEAMACGTPVVVTTEGGLWAHTRLGMEAMYADPNDTDAYGHTLLQVLRFPRLTRRLGRRGARLARSRFTWMNVARALMPEVTSPPAQQAACPTTGLAVAADPTSAGHYKKPSLEIDLPVRPQHSRVEHEPVA